MFSTKLIQGRSHLFLYSVSVSHVVSYVMATKLFLFLIDGVISCKSSRCFEKFLMLKCGLGQACKKDAKPEITEEEETKVWEKGLLGSHSAESLLHTVYYYK